MSHRTSKSRILAAILKNALQREFPTLPRGWTQKFLFSTPENIKKHLQTFFTSLVSREPDSGPYYLILKRRPGVGSTPFNPESSGQSDVIKQTRNSNLYKLWQRAVRELITRQEQPVKHWIQFMVYAYLNSINQQTRDKREYTHTFSY